MDTYEVMRSTFACRKFTGDPVPQPVLHRILEHARFAPSGGNRQGWRVIQVNRAEEKQAIADLSLPCATRYLLQLEAGEKPMNTVHPSSVSDADVAAAAPPLWLVEHIRYAPTLLVVTVDLGEVAAMDRDLERAGLVSGGSIYPLAWNILLGARNEGYGGTITTWGIAREPELQSLLKIPADWAIAAIMPLGKPLKQLTHLRRKPVAEILAQDHWDNLVPDDSAS